MRQGLPRTGPGAFAAALIAVVLLADLTRAVGDAQPAFIFYPAPQSTRQLAPSNVAVSINGQAAFVYALMHQGRTWGGIENAASDFAMFEFRRGPLTVQVEYKSVEVRSVRVYQLGSEIPAKIEGRTVAFAIAHAGAYVVEVNNDIVARGPVVIFANSPDQQDTSAFAPTDVVFKPGSVTDAGVIKLTRTGQRLYIPGGAVVRGSVHVVGARGVRIGGAGVLLHDDRTAANPAIRAADSDSPILAIDASDLKIADLVVVVSPTTFETGPGKGPVAPWAVHIQRSDDVVLTSVKILNGLRDGLDVDGSSRLTMEGGFVQAHDDVLCIKSTNYGIDGGARGRPVTDVLFQNLLVMSTGPGNVLRIGTELHTPEVARITYRNIDILHAPYYRSAALAINNGDRADVRDILYDGIRVRDQPGQLMSFTVETDGYLPDPQRGTVENVTVRNLAVDAGVTASSQLSGADARHTVRGVVFENFRRGATPTQLPQFHIANAPAPTVQ